MNDFDNVSAESEFRDEMTVLPEEQDTPLGQVYGDGEDPYDGGWPGDGSGTDDLADFNANEAMDYLNE